jgi:hypothetical protein
VKSLIGWKEPYKVGHHCFLTHTFPHLHVYNGPWKTMHGKIKINQFSLPLSLKSVLSLSLFSTKTYERVEGNGVWFEIIRHKLHNIVENDLGPGFIPPSSKYLAWSSPWTIQFISFISKRIQWPNNM